jgi:biopolymer transport protein ExbD
MQAAGDDEDMITGINVTPLVDITLVLLIIFMVTAPMIMAQGIAMDLPQAAKSEELQTIFSVELAADGKTYVDSKAVANDQAIIPLAEQAKKKTKDLRAVIRADKKVEHGRVIAVLDALKRSGVNKIAFAVSPAEGAQKDAGGVPIDTNRAP